MKNFGQLKSEVARALQITNQTYIDTQIRDFLNRTYEDIWNREWWPSLMSVGTVTVPAGQNTFTLPKKNYTAIRAFRGSHHPLVIRDLPGHMDYKPAIALATLGDVGVLNQLTTPQVPKVVSSSAEDTAVTVFVRGQNTDGEDIWETAVVTGTTPVALTKTYAAIESFSKTANSTGVISLTNNAGTVTLATIGVNEVSPRYSKYRLDFTAPTDTELTLVLKRRFTPFVHTFDTPFCEMDGALLTGAEAKGWREHRQFELAAQRQIEFEQEIAELIAREINNDGSIEIFAPMVRA